MPINCDRTSPTEVIPAITLNNIHNKTVITASFKVKAHRNIKYSTKTKKNFSEQYIQEFPKTRTAFRQPWEQRQSGTPATQPVPDGGNFMHSNHVRHRSCKWNLFGISCIRHCIEQMFCPHRTRIIAPFIRCYFLFFTSFYSKHENREVFAVIFVFFKYIFLYWSENED